MATGVNLCDENKKLSYTIHRFSSYSNNYFPENILLDRPSDQASRWSANTNHPPQYLVLKLKRPAVVRRIKFGKFEKNHVCNIKKFCIYGGMDEERLTLLLEGGLRNDHIPEMFNLRCRTEEDSADLPILYMKIVPLLSWGPTFNFSIWYIELHGQDDPMFTSQNLTAYNRLREIEIVKLCLKHFRQQGYYAAYKALQSQTNVRLEHPYLSQLHKRLVIDGDFERAEQIVSNCIEEGLIDDYLNRQDYRHLWRLQQAAPTELPEPGNRGGHQMVINNKKRLIYLYGGWDGYQDLSDLWAFDILTNSWKLLCEQSELCNGPTPRSCHKMVYDPVSENIFMIGRYLDNSIRTAEYIKSDFFLYDTRSSSWMQICDDTSQVGGPQLVFDHQMCIDVDKRTIYVFGGKILTPRSVSTCISHESEYSGLFSYHIATNTWTQILVDCHHPSASLADVPSIKSRITHCMVFHNKHRKLYVYGGQRREEEIEDFFSYDVDTQVITVLNRSNCSTDMRNEPSTSYTLRATIDCDRDEIYVFSSLCKQKDRRDVQNMDAANSFWVYSLNSNKWSHIYTRRLNNGSNTELEDETLEPCPRYAHQLVFDDISKLHYLFGGNPAKPKSPQLRLDDFWTLQLEKPKRIEYHNQCRFLIRKLRYEEMTREDPFKAMEYLRSKVAEVVDHNNKEQLNNFHKLASLLFRTEDPERCDETLLITPPLVGLQIADKEKYAGILENNPIESNDTSHEDDDSTPNSERLINSDDQSSGSFESLPPGISSEASSFSTSTTASIHARFNNSRTAATQTQIQTDAAGCGDYVDRYENKQRPSDEKSHKVRAHRAFLFNKLVQLMPQKMVQPERNLSDFIVM